jgi:uncharacterized membrane protein YjfL (UPF0719 family)
MIDMGNMIFAYYILDFFIVALILAGLKQLSTLVAGVSADQLLSESNSAYGITLAGALLAVAIMLTGVVSGEFATNLLSEFLSITTYGVLGVVIMWLTRILFDRFSFPDLSIHDEIKKGNTAASIIDAGNMLATALIVSSLMHWVDGAWQFEMMGLLIGYAFSQFILIIATKYRSYLYAKNNQEKALHQAIEEDNIALALRFSGYRIGVSLAMTSASGVVIFSQAQMQSQLLIWFAVAMVLFSVVTLSAIVFKRIIFMGADILTEVDKNKNIAVGCIEASIYIALGLIVSGLFN